MSVIKLISNKTQEIHDNGDIIHGEQEMISSRIVEMLDLDDKNNKQILLPVFGLPWAGKWWTLKALARELQVKLKKKASWNENELKIWDVHDSSNTHTIYVMLDAFFKEIWALRRTEMLSSMSNFIDMFSDDEKAIAFISKYLKTYDSFEQKNVYLKTDKERAASAALSKLSISWKKNTSWSLIFIDWVNAHMISDSLYEKDDSLEVIKLMVYPRLELAFQRIIRRDHVWSQTKEWKPIKEVVQFRLKEAFYLFKAFTAPALSQDNINMIDFTPNTVNDLSKDEIIETLKCLNECKDELLAEDLWYNFDKYLIDYTELLLTHFNYLLYFKKYFLVNRYDDTKTETIKWVNISFEELAERVWNLYYDSLSVFLSSLSEELKSNEYISPILKSVAEDIDIWEPHIDLTKAHYKHTTEVKWIWIDKITLASLVARLKEDKLKEFLLFLSQKLKKDWLVSEKKWRKLLSIKLFESSSKLKMIWKS